MRVWRFLLPVLAGAASPVQSALSVPPHLGTSGQTEYGDYRDSSDYRAFAIAPGGAWGWSSGKSTAEAAEDEALAMCQGQTEQRCVTYAIGDRVVFDAKNWTRLWRPYSTAAQTQSAQMGRRRGQRMFDIAFANAHGKPDHLSSLRGKVVVLHFWGAWCPPCRREMPDLQKLRQSMAARKDIVFLVLQGREKFEVSRDWARKQGITLPLSDSGSSGEGDTTFRLAAGGTVKDREIADRFPMTYVLDRRGLVVFSHVGPIPDWSQYEPFLKDLAAHPDGQ